MLHIAAIAAGLVTWIVVSLASGKSEAWDSGWYFSAALPVVYSSSAVLAYLEPERWWRWAVTPFAAQAVLMVITTGAGNLLPIGILFFVVLSAPSLATAKLGALIGKRRRN